MPLDRPLLPKLLDNQPAHNPRVVLASGSHNQQQALALALVRLNHQVAVGLVSHNQQQAVVLDLVSLNHQVAVGLVSHRHQHWVDLVSHKHQLLEDLVSHNQYQAAVLASTKHKQVLALVLGHLSQVLQCLVRLSLRQHHQHQLLGGLLVRLHQVTLLAVRLRHAIDKALHKACCKQR